MGHHTVVAFFIVWCSVQSEVRFLSSGVSASSVPEFSSANTLVSLIIVTRNRCDFLGRAITMIDAQTHKQTEVIIVDDSTTPCWTPTEVQTLGKSLDRSDSWIQYSHLKKSLTIGAKRNLACEKASGGIFMSWDDDDYYRPGRITHQIESIVSGQADITTYEHGFLFFVLDQTWKYHVYRPRGWGPHFGSLTFHRRIFDSGVRFPDYSMSEDYGFAEFAIRDKGAQLEILPNHEGNFVYVRHFNTWNFEEYEMPALVDADTPEWFTDDDKAFYERMAVSIKQKAAAGEVSKAPTRVKTDPAITWRMSTINRRTLSTMVPPGLRVSSGVLSRLFGERRKLQGVGSRAAELRRSNKRRMLHEQRRTAVKSTPAAEAGSAALPSTPSVASNASSEASPANDVSDTIEELKKQLAAAEAEKTQLLLRIAQLEGAEAARTEGLQEEDGAPMSSRLAPRLRGAKSVQESLPDDGAPARHLGHPAGASWGSGHSPKGERLVRHPRGRQW